jgi:hypothetical protein
MAVFIPCEPANAARWSQRTNIAGREFVLTFDWNERTGHWSLTLADQDGTAIAAGLILATGARLLRGVVGTRRPPGELVVVDTLGVNDLDPGFLDLGARFALVYFDPGELTTDVLP